MKKDKIERAIRFLQRRAVRLRALGDRLKKGAWDYYAIDGLRAHAQAEGLEYSADYLEKCLHRERNRRQQ